MNSPADLVSRFRHARTDPALAVLEGFHALKHALRFGAALDLVVSVDRAALDALALQLAPDVRDAVARSVTEIPLDLFAGLSSTPPDTGVIAIAQRSSARIGDALSRHTPVVLLEAPAHSGNIGAAIRVAAAAGAGAVLTTGSNDPWNPGALRGSAGLHFALPVLRTTLAEVPAERLIAIDPGGEALDPAGIPRDAILAFGSERRGLSPELLERSSARVRIPMEPGVSSLNLATAVAVVLYLWRMQR